MAIYPEKIGLECHHREGRLSAQACPGYIQMYQHVRLLSVQQKNTDACSKVFII